MRILITLLLLGCMPYLLPAQTPAINKFYRNHKKMENVTNVSLPGWLIKFGSGIAKKHVEDVEEEAFDMVKQVKKMRLLVAEDGGSIPNADVTEFLSDLEGDDFVPLLSIRNTDQHVHVMMREKKEILRNLLILVDSDDTFMMLSLKTKVKFDDIADLVMMAVNGDWEMEEVEVQDDEIVLPKA